MNRTCKLLILILFVLFSCRKTITELPVPTEIGANTFGCRIDGEFWEPAPFGIVPTTPILEARFLPGWDLIINARNFSSSPTESEIEIHLKKVTAPGIYLLNTNTDIYPSQVANYGYYVKRRFTPQNEWITTPEYTGQVNISRTDTLNNIVSGTFSFRAINLYNAPQPIEVTEGRFDIKIP